MKLIANMPYSELHLESGDQLSAVEKLKSFLTFTVKIFSVSNRPEKKKVCLLESDNGHFKFRTGLVYRVKKISEVLGISIHWIDLRKPVDPDPSLGGHEVKLWDFQEEAVEKVLKQDMGVLCVATGGGKTHMAASIIARRSVPTLFLVHTKELLYQAKERFESLLKIPIGIIGDDVFEPKPITVATVQTLNNHVYQGYLNLGINFKMLITDECHHIPAETFYRVTSGLACRYVHGLSATPDRKDGADLMIEAAAGPIVSIVSTSHLIAMGRLSRPVIRFVPIKTVTSYKSYPIFVLKNIFIAKFELRNKLIAELAIEQAKKGKSVVISVDRVQHAEILKSIIPGAILMIGRDESNVRQEIIKKIKNKDLSVTISTLVKEGLDIPSLDVIINGGGGTDIRQLVGRVLRRSQGKENAMVIDFIDNQHIVLQKNSQARMRRCETESEFVVITG